MSYYASGYGELTTKEPDKIDDVLEKALERKGPYYWNWEISKSGPKNDMISFEYCYDIYHEEDVLAVLDILTPITEEGSQVEFSGEDDSHWAFELKGGKWHERSGYVVYEDAPEDDAFYIIRGGLRFYLTDAELKAAAQKAGEDHNE